MNLYQKIITIYKEVKTVVKDDKVSTGGDNSYLAVSHDAVTRLLHMPIANAGIVVIPVMEECVVSVFEKEVWNKYDKMMVKKLSYRSDVWVSLTLVNSEKPDEVIKTKAFGMAFDSADKGPTKAYSMALKACLLKVFMLESLDKEEQRAEEVDATIGYFDALPDDDDYKPTYVPQPTIQKPSESVRAEAKKFSDNMSKPIVKTSGHIHNWKPSKKIGVMFCSSKLPNGEWCKEQKVDP